MKNVALLFFCLFMTKLSGQDIPTLFEAFDSRTEILETDEGDFLAWIVDGSDARKIYPKLRKLSKIEVDKAANFDENKYLKIERKNLSKFAFPKVVDLYLNDKSLTLELF